PQTTNDYLKLCKFIKDKTGIYGCMPIVDGTNLYFRFQEEGLSVLDQTKKRALFNGPPHVKLLATYVDLLANDYFPRDVLVRSYYGALELYAAEELAMLVTGPQFLLSRIKYDNLAVYKKTRVARYPLGNRKIIHSPLMNIAVSAKSKRPETAFEFALFVTNEENQVAFAKETVIFPSTILSSPVSRQFFLKGGSNPEDAARLIGFQSLPASRDLTPTFPIRKGIELAREFRNAIESAFYETKTPKEALDYAVQEWNRILAKP
ncbi:MAG: extracellular solute-binding protein, partial [Parcubacteria group bacterium]|nr:extracellular solute-binding protein [Parcubacteria group bacterium]